jgi:predicted SAM-dependent methyltransferase
MKNKTKKLNLGCGPSGINGWTNYDYGVLPLLSKFPQVRHLICNLGLLPKNYDVTWPEIELVDIKNKFPANDNSIDYIYCSQVLEHFNEYESKDILKESHRVLKKGGIIRVSVPDIAAMLKLYEKNKDPRETNITWWGYEKDIPPANIIAKLSKFFIRDHQWHYDKNSMKKLLKNCGFKKVTVKSFRKGNVPDLAKVELEIHRLHSLYIEAEK